MQRKKTTPGAALLFPRWEPSKIDVVKIGAVNLELLNADVGHGVLDELVQQFGRNGGRMGTRHRNPVYLIDGFKTSGQNSLLKSELNDILHNVGHDFDTVRRNVIQSIHVRCNKIGAGAHCNQSLLLGKYRSCRNIDPGIL